MAATHALPMILDEVSVVSVERISPTFARIGLGSPALAELGVSGPWLDQRVKLIFPGASGRVPSFEGADESWYAAWLDLPLEERGTMRTYTVREVQGAGADTVLLVDFVLHLEDGATGPGSRWAANARPGDRLVLLAPRRGVDFGGIEFQPGAAHRFVIAGDETAVPAICSILAGLPADSRGAAFLEVPLAGDVCPVSAPPGVEVRWLPRDGAPLGQLLHRAVVGHLGGRPDPSAVLSTGEIGDDADLTLWETPNFSSSGDDTSAHAPRQGRYADLYAWIAGESAVVTGLRRHLVRGLGIDRHQVSFMGYWRRGVAMKG